MRKIIERLRAAYGKPELEPHRAPVDELVLTVLSQNTNDRNRDVAYGRLRERFPDWAAVRDAPQEEIEEAIRPGGLAPTKSKVIQNILRALDGDDLAWLETAPVEEGREYLCSLPGVGRKTAACVLLFSYGLPDVPVDTHVFRVGTRLGLFRPGASFEEAHDEMLRFADERLRAARLAHPPRPPHLHGEESGLRRVPAPLDLSADRADRPTMIC